MNDIIVEDLFQALGLVQVKLLENKYIFKTVDKAVMGLIPNDIVGNVWGN